MSAGGAGRTITRNTLFNAAGRSWEALLGLALTAYILSQIDYASWGLWSLVAVFVGYASLLDLGVGSAFVRFIAQHHARRDTRAVSEVVATGVAFYAGFGAFIVLAGWPMVNLLVDGGILTRLWGGGREEHAALQERAEDLRFLLHGGLVLFAVNGCIAPLAAVPSGLQRMGVANVISGGAAVVKLAATVYFLEGGHGVRGLVYANGATLGMLGAASAVAAFAVYPGLRLHWRQVRGEAFRELFGYGWRTQLAKLSELVNFQTDRLIIAAAFGMGGAGLAGLYRIGEELAGKLRQLPAMLVSALIPAAADLHARAAEERTARLYVVSTKYVAALAFPLTAFTLAGADVMMIAWLGPMERLDTAAAVLRILMAGYLLNLLPGPGMSIALGAGRADLAMRAGLISMSANLLLTVLLVWQVGFYGVPIATALGMAISTAWFLRRMPAIAGTGFAVLFRRSLGWPLAASVPAGLAAAGLFHLAAPPETRLAALALGGGGALLFGAVYLACLRAAPFLDDFDRAFLLDTLGLRRLPGAARLLG